MDGFLGLRTQNHLIEFLQLYALVWVRLDHRLDVILKSVAILLLNVFQALLHNFSLLVQLVDVSHQKYLDENESERVYDSLVHLKERLLLLRRSLHLGGHVEQSLFLRSLQGLVRHKDRQAVVFSVGVGAKHNRLSTDRVEIDVLSRVEVGEGLYDDLEENHDVLFEQLKFFGLSSMHAIPKQFPGTDGGSERRYRKRV